MYLNKHVILGLIQKIKQIKDEINEKGELPIYEKVRVIYTLFTVFYMREESFTKVYELIQLNIRYLITNEKKENSIMDRCYNFYNLFIDSITEESAIFPYLLNIDSGCGYYNQDMVYSFDLKTIEMIKSHLRQVFPKIIILCFIENGDVALTESEFGGIIINEFYLTKLKNIDYNSSTLTQITVEHKDDIAMNYFLDMIHEGSGHKKYALSDENNNSPKKIFNKDNKIIELKHRSQFVPNDYNSEYILSNMNYKGDSGHYLELCYGKYKNELIVDILRNMENKGKLIRYPELFTDDVTTLNEYVSLRKQIQENKIKLELKHENSIEEDIKQMKEELNKLEIKNNKNEYITEKNPNNNEINQNIFLNQGKRKRDEKDTENFNVNNNNSKKKYEANYLKSNINAEKEGNKKGDVFEKIANKSEIIQIPNRKERLNIAAQRVAERFNIKLGPCLKRNLKKIIKELDPNDPNFEDVSLLLSDCYIKY